jgi:hypothetical protein
MFASITRSAQVLEMCNDGLILAESRAILYHNVRRDMMIM